MVQEGNNNDSKKFQGPKRPDVQRSNELKGYSKYKYFMTCKTTSFNYNEDSVRVMDWISEMELTFISCNYTGKLQRNYVVW